MDIYGGTQKKGLIECILQNIITIPKLSGRYLDHFFDVDAGLLIKVKLKGPRFAETWDSNNHLVLINSGLSQPQMVSKSTLENGLMLWHLRGKDLIPSSCRHPELHKNTEKQLHDSYSGSKKIGFES